MKWIAVCCFILAVGSCNKSVVSTGNRCEYLQKAGGTVSVCLDRVVTDSRCHPDSVCIWAGYVLADFTFTKNGSLFPIRLSLPAVTGVENADTILQGYRVEFLELSQPRNSSVPLDVRLSITPQ